MNKTITIFGNILLAIVLMGLGTAAFTISTVLGICFFAVVGLIFWSIYCQAKKLPTDKYWEERDYDED